MPNIILHLDMDCFFASCHQQGNPFLRQKPIAVVGNFQGKKANRSVIAAASLEAKKLGVKNGMSLIQAKKLCPEIIFVEAESARYEYIADKVFKIMSKYGTNLKIFSIDEAAINFQKLDIKNKNDKLKINEWEKVKKIALAIKKEIENKLGKYLTCSIGISYNYILAKLASDLSKPNGLKIIKKNKALHILKFLTIDKIVGIGEKTKEKLSKFGIKTFQDLQNTSDFFLKYHFGIYGINLKNISLGGDSFYYYKKTITKSIGHSQTFPFDTLNKNLLHQYLQNLSEKVAFRLRQKNLEGKGIALTIRLKDFKTFSKQKNLDYFTFDGYEIFKEAAKMLDSLNINLPIRLIGLSIFHLRKANQLFLFEKNEKRNIFLKAIDAIKKRYGQEKIFPLAIKKVLR
jgi:DNA polymerase-4